MNIFEQASRKAIRFTSIKGLLTVEQLWDLPLQSKTGFSLDEVAKAANQQLKATAEESFVTDSTPVSADAKLHMDVILHIIAVRKAENAAALTAAARKEEKQKLLALIEDKKDDALKGESIEQLKARLEALG